MCGFSRNEKPVTLTDTDVALYQSMRVAGLTERQAAAYLRYVTDRLRRHTYIGVRKAIKLMEL